MKPDAARSGSLIRWVESIAKPAEPPRWLSRFLCWEFGKEGRVVIFQGKVARPRGEAVRAGWNDAAWGQRPREVDPAVASLYECGYAGGLVFRQKQQQNSSAPDILDPLPHIAPAA